MKENVPIGLLTMLTAMNRRVLFRTVLAAGRHSLARSAPSAARDVTLVLIHCGETTFDRAMASAQSAWPQLPIEVVRNVHPLPAALDAAMDACRTPWMLTLDADVILFPWAVSSMVREIAPDVGSIEAQLYDKVYGVIGTLRLQNVAVLKEHKFRHSVGHPFPDRLAIGILCQEIGLRRISTHVVTGVHDPYSTPFEAFRRFYGIIRKNPSQYRDASPHFEAITRYLRRTLDTRGAYFMFSGLTCGLFANMDSSRDYIADMDMQNAYAKVERHWFRSAPSSAATNAQWKEDDRSSEKPV